MGRRNIYVAAEREGLYDEAALMAGSLSAAIDAALEEYVRSVRAGWLRTELFERRVGRGSERVAKQFRARFVTTIDIVDPASASGFAWLDVPPPRRHGIEIFQGLSGRLAVWHWSDPDWTRRGEGHGVLPDDWFERWGHELRRFDDADALRATFPIDEEDHAALVRRLVSRAVEPFDL